MRITPAATVIALLAVSNAFTAYLAVDRQRDIRADHLQQVRLDTNGDGTILVTLGTSDTPAGPVATNPHHAATLELTPRAAIQLQVELSRTIQLVQEAAKVQRVELGSARPAL